MSSAGVGWGLPRSRIHRQADLQGVPAAREGYFVRTGTCGFVDAYAREVMPMPEQTDCRHRQTDTEIDVCIPCPRGPAGPGLA